MNWDDLRFVLAVAKAGTLVGAAKALGVDHTTVGRRIESAERGLELQLFTRSSTGYFATQDAERLLAAIGHVEEAVAAVSRLSASPDDRLEGRVVVTSPETLGTHYLASRLAEFGIRHPGLVVALEPGGTVLDLNRQQAEVAIRPFRSKDQGLVSRRVARVKYGLYASEEYLSRHAPVSSSNLQLHRILSIPPSLDETESRWLRRLHKAIQPCFTSELSTALLAAAKQNAGLAILPRYLGDIDKSLKCVPMPNAPHDTLWLTVHRDLRKVPRIRAVLDFLVEAFGSDAGLFEGR